MMLKQVNSSKNSIFNANYVISGLLKRFTMRELVFEIFGALFNREYLENSALRRNNTGYLADFFQESISSEMNFYPGKPTNTCFERAVFVSISKKTANLKGDQYISSEEMLRMFFEHIFLKCLGTTRRVLFVCDQFDTSLFGRYKPQFEALNTLGIDYEIWYFKKSGPENITKLVI